MEPTNPDITQLLREWASGSRKAESELFTLVMPDLRRLAGHFMRGERQGHSLQPTELVNQIYVRLVSAKHQDWQNRKHFFAIAARAMRRYLVDHARGRPSVRFTALNVNDLLPAMTHGLDLAVTVDTLLDQLADVHPEWCQIVEVKYFLGLTDEEAAEGLGMALRSVQRGWRDSRQWLFERIEAGNALKASS